MQRVKSFLPVDMSAAEEAKQRGNDLFKGGKFRDAVQAYTEAISSDPQSDVLLLNRCAAYMALSDYRHALADAEQAVQLQGEAPTPKAIIRLSKCLVGVGRPRDGSSTLQPLRSGTVGTEAEQKQAQDVDLLAQQMERHLVTLEAYLREKNWLLASIALDQAQGVMKLTDASAPKAWQELRAMILLQRGQYSQAQSLAMDMYRSDPSDTDAILLGARVFLANNDVAKAITQAQAALRTDPDRADAKKFLRKCKTLSTLKDEANAAFKANRSDEALAKYAELLQVAGTDTDADGEAKKFKAVIHSNRAILLSKLSRFDESIQDCTQALQLDAGFVKPLKTRARAYLSSEKYEEAVRDFKRAVDSSVGTAEHDSLVRECSRAEVDLKRSKKQEYVCSTNNSYYKILGVPKTATESEIKKAFRRESLKHHPDKGGDEEKFKLCNEAYSVLSDEQKRRRYDSGVDDMDAMDLGGMGGMGGMGGFGSMGGMGGVNLADLFGAQFANFDMGPGGTSTHFYGPGASSFRFG